MVQAIEPTSGVIRLDVWLWAARFFKTRALAKAAIENGKIEVGGQRAKPARQVRAGDMLAIVRGEETFRVEVLACPASVAPRRWPPCFIARTKPHARCVNCSARNGRPSAVAIRRPNTSPTSGPGA